MPDGAVVLLDGKGQIRAREELVFGNAAMESLPIVGHTRVARDPDCFEMLLTGCIITPIQNPGKISPLDRVIRSPKRELFCLFLRK